MRTRIFTIASLVALSACGNSDSDSSQQADDGFIFTAPADTDTLPSDLPESEVAAIIALGTTGAERPPVDEHQHGGSHSGTRIRACYSTFSRNWNPFRAMVADPRALHTRKPINVVI